MPGCATQTLTLAGRMHALPWSLRFGPLAAPAPRRPQAPVSQIKERLLSLSAVAAACRRSDGLLTHAAGTPPPHARMMPWPSMH